MYFKGLFGPPGTGYAPWDRVCRLACARVLGTEPPEVSGLKKMRLSKRLSTSNVLA